MDQNEEQTKYVADVGDFVEKLTQRQVEFERATRAHVHEFERAIVTRLETFERETLAGLKATLEAPNEKFEELRAEIQALHLALDGLKAGTVRVGKFGGEPSGPVN